MFDVLAVVKILLIPTYFLALSCADQGWEELPYIINKLNTLRLSDKETRVLSYQEWCNLWNNNPVNVTRHFQYKVEVFLKEIINDALLGKTKYYVISIECQERFTPHIHSFICIFNAPNIQNEAAHFAFNEKTINSQFPDR